MNLNSTHTWSKGLHFGRSFKVIAASLVAMVVIALSAWAVSGATQSAIADDEASLSAARVDITIKDNGTRGAATRSLERTVYNVDDNLVLKWKGAVADGTDFYIPTEIKYGNRTEVLSILIPVNQIQDDNSEYKRRMGTAGNMATFEQVQKFVETEHSVDLGPVSALNTEVTITWQKVKPVYRLYNMLTSEHLFTTNKTEYDNFVAQSKTDSEYWIGEGISWLAPESGETVSRFYNAGLGALGHSSHYYSKDATEIANLEKSGWVNDGAANGFPSGGTTQIWTCYNEALGSAHHYTSSKDEWSGLAQHGWALEQDKNGTDGVFQGVLATSWSYSDNYYKVEHRVDGQVYKTEWKEGVAGNKTDATALTIPGYTAGAINNVDIAANNSTVVTIEYTANTSTLTFNSMGGSAVDSQTLAYGAKLTKPATDPTRAGYTFSGWAYDEEGSSAVDFATATMPAKDLTLYAQWESDAQYTIKLVANNGSGDEQTITRVIGDGESLIGNPFTYVEGTTVHGFKTWNTAQDGTGTSYADRFKGDLTATSAATVTLYAQWTSAGIDPFWVAPSSKITTGNTADTANVVNPNYTNPETGIVKTGSEVQTDIAILKQGSGHEKYNETLAQYKEWMDKDSYHLYAKIQGVTGEDQYVEFRLVNLLGHESTGNKTDSTKYSDGSVFTIQAIHAMPLGYKMYSSDATNVGGWAATDLRENMNSSDILQFFNPELTNLINPVQKWNRFGSSDSEKLTTTNDRLWVMSYTELTGTASSAWGTKVGSEGDQYAFWKNFSLTSGDTATNAALSALTKTRSGNTPSGSSGSAWIRSAFPSSTTQFGTISAAGAVGVAAEANVAQALVPCFSVGTTNYAVTFNTNGGTAIQDQSVPAGGYAEEPTTPPTSSQAGYVFEGWYSDATHATKFDFENTAINAATTIYAKYVPGEAEYKVEVYLEEDTEGTYPTEFSHTYEATGTTLQNTDAEKVVTDKGIDEGYEIDTTKTENTAIVGNGSAVAKVYLKRLSYKITFNSSGKNTTAFPETATVRYNTLVTDPSPTPKADLWNFTGWYLDSGFKEQMDPGVYRMPAKDITVYANWEESKNTSYTVEHYLQNTDGTWANSRSWATTGEGEVDQQTDYTKYAGTPIGFSVNTKEGDEHQTKNVKIEASNTVLKIYYSRNICKVTYKNGSEVTEEEDQLYGADLKVKEAGTPASGFAWVCWSDDQDADPETAVSYFDTHKTVPNQETLTLYAITREKNMFLAAASTKTTGNTADKVNQKNGEYSGSPMASKKKSAAEIDKDLAILRAGESANSEEYNKIKTEYEGYMNDDSVHLYSKWVGSTIDSSGKEQVDNRWLEFRIIHVGDHDGDGSVLTFQMTHTIPTAFNLAEDGVTTSGWKDSALEAKIKEIGATYKKELGEIKTLTKKSIKGGTSKDVVETQDDFWIASATEIYGGNASATSTGGTQYDWFKKVLATTGSSTPAEWATSNPALVRKTRAGYLPVGENSYSGFQGRWWTRTPYTISSSSNKQVTVNNNGAIWGTSSVETLSCNYASGVVVCFAL
jgi:uncharacterized repeat protein (TIGR02543 family)